MFIFLQAECDELDGALVAKSQELNMAEEEIQKKKAELAQAANVCLPHISDESTLTVRKNPYIFSGSFNAPQRTPPSTARSRRSRRGEFKRPVLNIAEGYEIPDISNFSAEASPFESIPLPQFEGDDVQVRNMNAMLAFVQAHSAPPRRGNTRSASSVAESDVDVEMEGEERVAVRRAVVDEIDFADDEADSTAPVGVRGATRRDNKLYVVRVSPLPA